MLETCLLVPLFLAYILENNPNGWAEAYLQLYIGSVQYEFLLSHLGFNNTESDLAVFLELQLLLEQQIKNYCWGSSRHYLEQ